MGKKGAAMRAAKADSVRYTFTKAQLEAHDVQVRKQYHDVVVSDCREKLQKEADEAQKRIDAYLSDEWKKREKLLKGDDGQLDELLSLLLCIPARVLIEKFHWKPIPEDGVYDKRNKMVQFSTYLTEEVNSICLDPMKDIRAYCAETFEKYGVRYRVEEEEQENNAQEGE